MENFKKKVVESAKFYKNSFLKFDFKLNEYNYLTLKKYFKGDLAAELGPAIGQMTRFLVNDFKELHLIEGSKEVLDHIPNYKNVTKHHSFFEEFETKIKFDTIVMSHVLEHIKNPIEVLKSVKNWLSDEGVFIISVPNAKSIHRLAAVEMGILKNEYVLNERDHEVGHYRVYDIDSLKKDILLSGFQVIDSGGIFLKPLSNGQIDANWDEKMMDGFYALGKKFQDNCAEIFVVCSKINN